MASDGPHFARRSSTLRVIRSTTLSPPRRPYAQSVVPAVTTVPPCVQVPRTTWPVRPFSQRSYYSQSLPSGTLSGTVAVNATPSEPMSNYSITQLAFYLDDNPNYPVLSHLASSPSSGSQSTWNFDTNSLSNGTHTLLVVATDNEGNIGSATTAKTALVGRTALPFGRVQHKVKTAAAAVLEALFE